MASHSHHDTYADNESGVYLETDNHFVTFYDSGDKLTVKTTAATVKEALDRAGIIINDSDITEPSLDTTINMDNFFINIYRSHPAIVRDGKITEITTENTGGEKSEYYLKAEEALIAEILEKQSLEGIDTVAGATGTSESILAAMQGLWEQMNYAGPKQANSVKEPTLTAWPKPTV